MQKYKITLRQGFFTEEVTVNYRENVFTDMHHLEFYGRATSNTGYRSHFFHVNDIDFLGFNLEKYLMEIARELSGQEVENISLIVT